MTNPALAPGDDAAPVAYRVVDKIYTVAVALSPAECDERLVRGDLAESRGRHDEAAILRTEAAIGARIAAIGAPGYPRTLAAIGASLGLRHSEDAGRLV